VILISKILASLRSQILAFTSALVILSIGAVLLVVLVSSGAAIRQSVNADMTDAVRIFTNAMKSSQDQLTNTASVLVSDFGFKQAVASQDINTVRSMLENHSKRLDADLLFIMDLNGTVTNVSGGQVVPGTRFGYSGIVSSVTSDKLHVGFFVLNEQIYQMALVPVKTPRISAIAGIATHIDAEKIRNMIPDSRVHITFTSGDLGVSDDRIMVSTLTSLTDVIAAIRAPENLETIVRYPFERAQKYSSREIHFSSEETSKIKVILSDDLSGFHEKYESIRNKISFIAFVILLITIAGSFSISRRLTRPLSILTEKARNIARGRYSDMTHVPITSSDVDNLVTAFERMKRDLIEREERILYQASHDTLTSLLNRDAMIDAVINEVDLNKRLILMGINLVGFKTINDTLGMEIGDQCLVTVAQRLQKLAYLGISARNSADEFSVLLHIPDGVTTKDEKLLICQRLLKDLAAPMQLSGVSLSVEYRAGIIVYPDQASTPQEFLHRGKISLEHAITTSSPLYYYQEGQDQVHLRKIRILQHLKETIQNDDDQLQMYYQPKKNLRTGEVEKAEALIRWFHPDEGFIPPDTFIALAEQTGLIGLVTAWVVSRVLDDQAKMKDQGVHLQLSINLSAQDLSSDSLRVLIDQKLTQNNLSARDICLEVTERDMMTDVDKSLQLLNYYREQGFQLSIDDYGVGYSALSKLAMMPVHELKIDKCFILKLAHQRDDQIIVRSTINMAHELGLSVIAEGVEDNESQTFLSDLGCDYIQGYYLAKPMSFDSLILWVNEFENEKVTEK
jgi:diguanylate cyclase (GGDEF)-like protein